MLSEEGINQKRERGHAGLGCLRILKTIAAQGGKHPPNPNADRKRKVLTHTQKKKERETKTKILRTYIYPPWHRRFTTVSHFFLTFCRERCLLRTNEDYCTTTTTSHSKLLVPQPFDTATNIRGRRQKIMRGWFLVVLSEPSERERRHPRHPPAAASCRLPWRSLSS